MPLPPRLTPNLSYPWESPSTALPRPRQGKNKGPQPRSQHVSAELSAPKETIGNLRNMSRPSQKASCPINILRHLRCHCQISIWGPIQGRISSSAKRFADKSSAGSPDRPFTFHTCAFGDQVQVHWEMTMNIYESDFVFITFHQFSSPIIEEYWVWLKIIDSPNRWFPTKYDHPCGSFGTLILSHCQLKFYWSSSAFSLSASQPLSSAISPASTMGSPRSMALPQTWTSPNLPPEA